MRLSGKTAVVTGGARGLGAHMCQMFAAEGAQVVAVDLGEMTYEAQGVEYYQLNITDVKACREFFDSTIEKYGKIDILVNNAGIIKRIPMTEMKAEEFRQVIDIDLNAPFIVSKAVIPGMMQKGHGKIINKIGRAHV